VDALQAVFLSDFVGKPVWVWAAFIGVVVTLLALDLGVLHKDDREIGVRESLLLSTGYISMGLMFCAWVWWLLGAQSGMDYFTGFLIEKSLSMDNVFVIALIFGFFAIPRAYQHRVLFWGIMGVIVLRALMIGLGATLVAQFSWMLYLFGLFLLATGVKMLFVSEKPLDLNNNAVVKWMRGHMNVTDEIRDNSFWVRRADPVNPARQAWFATPLLLALVLVFIGAKIFLVGFIGKIPAGVSLGVTFGLLLAGVLFSLFKTRDAVLPSPPSGAV
jgi:tellurite resistance protein TerC